MCMTKFQSDQYWSGAPASWPSHCALMQYSISICINIFVTFLAQEQVFLRHVCRLGTASSSFLDSSRKPPSTIIPVYTPPADSDATTSQTPLYLVLWERLYFHHGLVCAHSITDRWGWPSAVPWNRNGTQSHWWPRAREVGVLLSLTFTGRRRVCEWGRHAFASSASH